jgi:hypothetical protein
MIVLLVTIVLQVLQLTDFKEWRSHVIEGFYLAVIVALLLTGDLLQHLKFW